MVDGYGKCEEGFNCFICIAGFEGPRCVRTTATDQFKLLVFLNMFPLFIYLSH